MNNWQKELERYLNEESLEDIYNMDLIKEMINYKPMKSELSNKEDIIKKQIQVIKELNLRIQSQDQMIDYMIEDWKELKEDCDKQTKEVKKLQDKIKLMGEMNNELQLENLKLKNNQDNFNPYFLYCASSDVRLIDYTYK